MTYHLRELTSPQVREAAARNTVLLLPFGQTEEHGDHLALGTDSIIAEHVCDDVAAQAAGDPPVLVMPSIQYGYSGADMHEWPGTFVVRSQVVIDYVHDVCCSAIRSGFRKLILVSAHGHHTHLCVVVARNVADATGVHIAVVTPTALDPAGWKSIRKSAPGGCCHACEMETSLLMHYGYPVDLSLASDEDRLRIDSRFVPADGRNPGNPGVWWSTWALQKSKHGVYGDPTVATAETGRRFHEMMVARLLEFAKEFHALGGERPSDRS